MTNHGAQRCPGAAASAAQEMVTTASELDRLAAAYPAFRFSRENVGRHGACWVAERLNRLGYGVRTVITADIAELDAALSDQAADHEGTGHAG
jgi:hypothetical protein